MKKTNEIDGTNTVMQLYQEIITLKNSDCVHLSTCGCAYSVEAELHIKAKIFINYFYPFHILFEAYLKQFDI